MNTNNNRTLAVRIPFGSARFRLVREIIGRIGTTGRSDYVRTYTYLTPDVREMLGRIAESVYAGIDVPNKPQTIVQPEHKPNKPRKYAASPIPGVVKRSERIQTEAENLVRAEFGCENDNQPIKDRTYILDGVRYSFDRGEPIQPPKGVPTYTLTPNGRLIPNKGRTSGRMRYVGEDTVSGRVARGGSASVGRDSTGQTYKARTGKRSSVVGDDCYGRSASDWEIMSTPIKNQTDLTRMVSEHTALIRSAIVRKATRNPYCPIRGGDVSAIVQDTIGLLLGVRWGDTGKGTIRFGTGYVRADQAPTDWLGERSRPTKRKVNGRVVMTIPFAERFPNGKPLGALVAAACLASIRAYSKRWVRERRSGLVGSTEQDSIGRGRMLSSVSRAERKRYAYGRSVSRTLSKQRALRMNPDNTQMSALLASLGSREATICRMLAAGYGQKHIATYLNCGQGTVSKIIDKIGETIIDKACKVA